MRRRFAFLSRTERFSPAPGPFACDRKKRFSALISAPALELPFLTIIFRIISFFLLLKCLPKSLSLYMPLEDFNHHKSAYACAARFYLQNEQFYPCFQTLLMTISFRKRKTISISLFFNCSLQSFCSLLSCPLLWVDAWDEGEVGRTTTIISPLY
jgi:hypothetical protein